MRNGQGRGGSSFEVSVRGWGGVVAAGYEEESAAMKIGYENT